MKSIEERSWNSKWGRSKSTQVKAKWWVVLSQVTINTFCGAVVWETCFWWNKKQLLGWQLWPWLQTKASRPFWRLKQKLNLLYPSPMFQQHGPHRRLAKQCQATGMHLTSSTLLQQQLRRCGCQPQALHPAPLPQFTHCLQNPTAMDGTQVVQHLKLRCVRKNRRSSWQEYNPESANISSYFNSHAPRQLLGGEGETTLIHRFLMPFSSAPLLQPTCGLAGWLGCHTTWPTFLRREQAHHRVQWAQNLAHAHRKNTGSILQP